jgi:hypothetical protein
MTITDGRSDHKDRRLAGGLVTEGDQPTGYNLERLARDAQMVN